MPTTHSPRDPAQWFDEHPLVPPAHLAAVRGAVPSDLVSDDDADLRKLEAELTARLDETAVQKMVLTLHRRLRAICTAGRSLDDIEAYSSAVEDAIMCLPPAKFRPLQLGYDSARIADGMLRAALEQELQTLNAAKRLHRAGEPAAEID